MKQKQKPKKISLPKWCKDWFKAYRYKVAHGGRGSAKSHSIARMLLIIASSKKTRILCAREVQNSIRDSVHKLLRDIIIEHSLEGFEITQNAITHVNGSEFIFKGLWGNSAESVKSMEGIDIVWIEEGQAVSQRSLDLLIPTIRKNGSEIWISFNPDKKDDAVYDMFVTNRPSNALVCEVNWQDNPWFPDVLRDEKDELYRINPKKADNVWGGKVKSQSDQGVFSNWKVIAFEPDDSFGPAYQGLDFGFSQDPMAFVRMYIHTEHKRIYFRYAIAKKGILPNSMAPFLEIVPDVKKYNTIADSARPELIAHLKADGFKIESAQKWPGSVEDGVQWMQDYELIVHPDCLKASYATEDEKYTIDHEFNNYSFKVDKRTGLITSDLEDKDNHYTDASRYGLQRFIKKKKSVFDNL